MGSASDVPLLEVRDLCFSWPDRPLFKNLNLVIPTGVSVVCGDESCGKTTLLRLLTGELQPDRGSIVWDPEDTRAWTDDPGARVFRTEPRSNRFDAIVARAWLLSLSSQFPAFDARLALELASGFSLEPHIDKPMYMLSAGSKRKVWLCGALAAGAPLTLIDEPFAALDLNAVGFLKNLLIKASENRQRAYLLADHVPPDGLILNAVRRLDD